MKTGIVVGIAVGAVLLSLGGGYAGVSYMTGSKYVEAYEAKMQEFGQAGVKPVTTVTQGMFATHIETKLPVQGFPVALIMTTDVDHQVTMERWLTAESTIAPDPQAAAMLKGFLKSTPKVTFNVTVNQAGSMSVAGQISPIVTAPNPTFSVSMPKPATFRYDTDENLLPTALELAVPNFSLAQGATKTEIQGLRFSTTGTTQGDQVSLKNQYVLKSFSMKGPGKKPMAVGPVKLNIDLVGLSKEVLLQAQAMASEGGAKADPMKTGLNLLAKSPGLKLVIPASSVKTSFGEFEIKGQARLKPVAGSPVPGAKGEFDIKMPFGKQANAIYGQQIAMLLRAYVKSGMVKRVGNSVTTTASLDGDSIKLNGKPVGAAAMKMSPNQQRPGMKNKSRGAGKKLRADRRGVKKSGMGLAEKVRKGKKAKRPRKKRVAH